VLLRRDKENAPMKFTLWISVAVLTTGLLAGAPKIASAQSDKTMGINCTVAGHIHCGENRAMGHRWHRYYRHHHRV
jgi:hypothetical protein